MWFACVINFTYTACMLSYGDWERDFDLLLLGCGDNSGDPCSSTGDGDFSCFNCGRNSGDTELLGDAGSSFGDGKYSLDKTASFGVAFMGDWSSEDGVCFSTEGDSFGEQVGL